MSLRPDEIVVGRTYVGGVGRTTRTVMELLGIDLKYGASFGMKWCSIANFARWAEADITQEDNNALQKG